MVELTDLDHQIIRAASQHFLHEGIRNTDMKQLAQELGISRSTLYRHFGNSVQIAFYVVLDYLKSLTNDDPMLYRGMNGYEAVCLYVRRLVDRLCQNLPWLQVIREFDALYSTEQHIFVPPEAYSQYISGDQDQPIVKFFLKGVADGSIRAQQNDTVSALALTFTCLALVERIMLREQNYIQEHGAAREIVDAAIELELSAIKN